LGPRDLRAKKRFAALIIAYPIQERFTTKIVRNAIPEEA